MPGRRGWGGGRRRKRRIRRFLEPCLLLLLHGEETHGYQLLEDLDRFGFIGAPADSSTIYRILRSLEEGGFVTSRWDEGENGPARRVYTLTESGDGYLQSWVAELEETDRILHAFFEEYRKHMELFHSGENRVDPDEDQI
jgi:PadR family transcriptional regulator, regulatory protein PadR